MPGAIPALTASSRPNLSSRNLTHLLIAQNVVEELEVLTLLNGVIFMKHLSLLLLLIITGCSAPSWSAEPPFDGLIPEQSINAHFISSNTKTRLLIQVLPYTFDDEIKVPSPDRYSTRQVDDFYKSSGEQIAVYVDSTPTGPEGKDYLSVPLPQEVENYDNIEFSRLCRSPETGLDQILLSLTVGGTANSDILDTLFIYYDPAREEFTSTLISDMFVESCSVRKSLQNEQEHERQRSDGRQLYQALKPHTPFELPKDFSEQITLTTKEITNEEISALQQRISVLEQRCRSYAHWEAPQRYLFEPLAENERWQIYALSYYEIWHSWGILLAHDKQNDRWTSFYSIPAGGSKVLLYLGEQFELEGNSLGLELCTECSWWGRFKDVELDLNHFSLSAADDTPEN